MEDVSLRLEAPAEIVAAYPPDRDVLLSQARGDGSRGDERGVSDHRPLSSAFRRYRGGVDGRLSTSSSLVRRVHGPLRGAGYGNPTHEA